MPARQPQIDRRQREERDDQHHAEVVRVARQRVHPVDVLAVDSAVDVDLGRAARERVEDEVVQAVAGELGAELEDSVDGVRGEADCEPAECPPEEALAALREVADRRHEEGEVDDELRHPLAELGQPLLRVDVPEPRELDERESREEAQHDRARSRQWAALGRDVRNQEQDRRDVIAPDLARDVPVHLLEGRDEEGREEEPRHDAFLGARHHDGPAGGECGGSHARLLSRSASSSTRPLRESRRRQSSESGVPSRLPACQRRWRSCSASRSASTSSDGTTTPAAVSRTSFAAAPSGGTAARIGRSAARYSKIFPVRTPRPRPPDSGIRRSSASESRWSSSEWRRDTSPSSSMRSPSPSDSAYSRSAARKSPAKRATTSSRPDSASARRNGFGSRFPWKWPACVIRRRSLEWCSRPAKSSKSQPLAIVTTLPFGSSARISSAIASETATIASAFEATSFPTPPVVFSFSRASCDS